MDAKTEALRSWLKSEFSAAEIEYEFSNELHKFRINGKPTHWLFVSREVVDDNESGDLLDRAKKAGIAERMQKAEKSKWIFLGDKGAKEVDESFAKPKLK